MKKGFFFLLLMISTFTINANVAQLFEIDEATISTEMADLENLEAFVEMNQGVTLADVQEINSSLTTNILPAEESAFSQSMQLSGPSKGPIGIPSFLWGCCLGPFGVGFVYLVAQDNREGWMSILGCLVWSVGIGISYIFQTAASIIPF